MKITKVEAFTFHTESVMWRDSEGHSHPGRTKHDASTPFLMIECDDGTTGYMAGGRMDVDTVNHLLGPELVGKDPLMRENIWQKLKTWQRLHPQFSERSLCAVDCALWDIAGKKAGLPVWKMIGGYRDKVPAYASIMTGDGKDGPLATPRDYADYALELVKRGYKGIKLHTWMPPMVAEPDPKLDVEACAMVREAVGPDIRLMLDPYHYYSRMQALYIARELEKLDFAWLEEPMDENSIPSYRYLARETSLPICGPETAMGKIENRAMWIESGAADLGRAGVEDMGGITPVLKAAHLYEAFGMNVELHGATIGNLQILGAIKNGGWYERGLLHPWLDYDATKPYLTGPVDPMDEDGNVQIPTGIGLGWKLNLAYIMDNRI